jgi:hypothetical protein
VKSYFLLPVIVLGCGTSSQQTVKKNAAADSAWQQRVRAGVCRRPTYATSTWPEFSTAKHLAKVHIPPFLHQERYQAASESTKAGRRQQTPRYATAWDNTDSKDGLAQFYVGVPDSVRLVYPGPAEPEESICIEQIDGAQATVFASNRGASAKRPTSLSSESRASGDSAAPLGPYMVETTMRYPDGLSFLLYGMASTQEQQNQMLAAMRTIRRIDRR